MRKKANEKGTTLYAIDYPGQGVYVGDCAQDTYKDTVHKHLSGKRNITRKAAQWCMEHGIKPHMYELERIGADDNVLQHKVAQIRWLIDNGCRVITWDSVMQLAMELDTGDAVYQAVAQQSMSEIFTQARDMLRNRRTTEERRRKPSSGASKERYVMSMTVDGVLRAKIEREARARGVPYTVYIRDCVRADGCGHIDISPVVDIQPHWMQHTNAVDQLCDMVIANRWCTDDVASKLLVVQAQAHEDYRKACSELVKLAETIAGEGSLY